MRSSQFSGCNSGAHHFSQLLVRGSKPECHLGRRFQGHDPNSRELEGKLMGSGSVFVESLAPAMREAGDVVMAVEEGHLLESDLIEIKELFRGSCEVSEETRRIYKSTGMSWQDLAIMAGVEQIL